MKYIIILLSLLISLQGISQQTKKPNGISLFRINKLTMNEFMHFCDTSKTEKQVSYTFDGSSRYHTIYSQVLVEFKLDTSNYRITNYAGPSIFHPKVKMFKLYGYRIPNPNNLFSGLMSEMELLFFNDTLKEVTFEAHDEYIYNKLKKEYGPGVIRKEVNPSDECYNRTDIGIETIWKDSKYYIKSWKKDYYFENCNAPKTYREIYFGETKYNVRDKYGNYTSSPWWEEGSKYEEDFESKYLKKRY